MRVPWTTGRSNQSVLKKSTLTICGRTDAKAKASILRLPDVKSQLNGKDPDAGKDRGQEEKQVTEDEMTGWHHQLNGHAFEQTVGKSEGQKAWHAAVHGVTKSQVQLSD